MRDCLPEIIYARHRSAQKRSGVKYLVFPYGILSTRNGKRGTQSEILKTQSEIFSIFSRKRYTFFEILRTIFRCGYTFCEILSSIFHFGYTFSRCGYTFFKILKTIFGKRYTFYGILSSIFRSGYPFWDRFGSVSGRFSTRNVKRVHTRTTTVYPPCF
jgi:hypothetical protein